MSPGPFINLMFRAFRLETEPLQEAKGESIARYHAAHGGADPFEDRSVEILNRVEIKVPRQLAASASREETGR